MGMPIVKSNVEAHGGTISCKSDPGKGTVFVIPIALRENDTDMLTCTDTVKKTIKGIDLMIKLV